MSNFPFMSIFGFITPYRRPIQSLRMFTFKYSLRTILNASLYNVSDIYS